ncbi:MAG: hypothetical protein ACREN4_05505, partial [Candidatus Dormibacteria bacterium]
GCSAMVNLIGTHPDPARLAGLPLAHPHLYGKAPRPGRKLGHVTFQGDDTRAVTEGALALARELGMDAPPTPATGSYWG